MSERSQDENNNDFKGGEVAHLFLRGQAAATGMAGLAWVGGVSGFLLLFVYLKVIGRSDVFLPSLELGPSLLFVVFMSGFFGFWLLASLIMPSYLVSMANDILGEVVKQEETGAKVTVWLAFAGVAVWTAIVLSAFLLGHDSVYFPMASLFFIIFLSSGRYIFFNKSRIKPRGDGENKWRYHGKIFTLWVAYALLITFASIISMLIAVLVINTHYLEGGESEWYLSFVIIVNMLATLLPAFFYYFSENKGLKAKWIGVLLGVLLFIAILGMTSPSTVKWSFVKTLNIVGVSDYKVRNYYVAGSEYDSEMLNAEKWRVSNLGEKGFGIAAILLYRFGSVSLLCPPGFPVNDKKMLAWSERVGDCIPFKSKYILPLDREVK